MKQILLSLLFAFSIGTWGWAQTITMTGTAGGSNSTTSCSGTFVDAGGAGGAYPSTVGTFTQIICASGPDDILHLEFSSLNLNQGGGPSNDDDIRVYLGSGTGGTLIYDAPADVIATDLDFYSQTGGCLTIEFIQAGTNNGAAPGWSANVSCINTTTAPLTSSSALVVPPTGYYFTDQGGLAGNMDGAPASGGGAGYYSNSSQQYITLCPQNPGEYVTINFLEFKIENAYETMVVLDGGISGGIIGQYTNTNSPGTITSGAYDGCLTLWFNSDANFSAPGWLAYVSTTTTPGVNSYCCETYNCSGGCGIWICVSGEFEPNTGGGQGCVEDLRGPNTLGCNGAAGEVNSTWYYFSPETSGTLGFTISPPGGLDFDYAIWKSPYDGGIACPLNTNEPPIRCSYSAANGDVGLDFTSTDLTEGAAGDNWTRYMDVVAGETYMMLLNCFSSGSPQANPLWTWTGTATLDCTPDGGVLSSNFLEFYGKTVGSNVELHWKTTAAPETKFYEVHRGFSPGSLEKIAQVEANGLSKFSHLDENLRNGTYYYQIVEFSSMGQGAKSSIVEMNFNNAGFDAKMLRIVNILGEDVTADPPKGQVLIKVYDNGATEKFVIHD
jgi:hypothetical protein